MTKSEASKKRSMLVMAAAAIVVVGLCVLAWKFLLTKETVIEGIKYIQSFGALSMLVFLLAYVLLVSMSFPSSFFNISAGIIFSFTPALGIALVAGCSASVFTFLISRYLIREPVLKKISNTEKGQQILDMAEEHGASLIIMARLNPFVPAVVKNYGFAVTKVPLPTYIWATLVGQLPLTSIYVYMGWVGGHAMLGEDTKPASHYWLMLAAGVIVSMITLYFAHSRSKKWLSASPSTTNN